ncbi:MAG TPA: TlpA disulfide reductase family protein [Acidimicrobiia bacterium]|nr:TlpA disulfide reductase family protein [Acidimicrobiia bacterium]
MRRNLALLIFLLAVLTGCAGSPGAGSALPDLPEVTASEFETHLAGLGRPAVVNVWASWCLPCRSEAPLLTRAAETYGNQIEFIGVDVQDSQTEAKDFLVEYGLTGFDHFFDPSRAIPNHYNAFGTPVTLFFAPGGELVRAHEGIVDERTLALNIDELVQLEG